MAETPNSKRLGNMTEKMNSIGMKSLMKWKEIKDPVGSQPRARHGHRCVSYGKYMIVIGGGNDGIMSDINILNTENNKWLSPGCSKSTFIGCAAYGLVRVDQDIFMFGGILESGEYTNEVNKISLIDWSIIFCDVKLDKNVEKPLPRLGHSFSLASGKRIFMFGGLTNVNTIFNTSIKYLNDLYILKIDEKNDNLMWIQPECSNTPPIPRESHSSLIYFYNNRETLIIYGGMCGRRLGDIHFLDLETLSWSQPVINGFQPPPRSLHVSGICHNKMIIFGGWIPSKDNKIENLEAQVYTENDWQCTNGVYFLNLDNLLWEPAMNLESNENMPKPRAGHSGCIINNRLYIWSGRDGFRKSWNDQVCCKDLWYLETAKPDPPEKLMIDGSDVFSVNLKWESISNADFYLVQVMKVGANTVCNSRDVQNIIERNAKNNKNEIDSVVNTQPLSMPALKLVATQIGAKIDDIKIQGISEIKSQVVSDNNEDSTKDPHNYLNNSTGHELKAKVSEINIKGKNQQNIDAPKNINIALSAVQNDQGSNENKIIITSTPLSKSINLKINHNTDKLNRLIPPLAISVSPLGQLQKQTNLVSSQTNTKSIAFSDVPIGKWFESIIVSEPRGCITQFYFDLNNEKPISCRTFGNRRSIQLESNYTYRLRVASVNSCGIGYFSRHITFSTTAPGLPGPPKNVKVIKNSKETYMRWSSSENDENLEYYVYMSRPIKSNSSNNLPEKFRDLKYLYDKIYQGRDLRCSLAIKTDENFILGTEEKPFLMLRIVAKNLRGYGPVTQIKWYKSIYLVH